jgi:hypothetical protein
MKTSVILISFLIAGILGISGCKSENTALKNDASNIAGVMCKSIEAMKTLREADPSDSLLVKKLQSDYEAIEAEMTLLNENFRKKYSDRVNEDEFKSEFRKLLSESMLECKSLSKEDRAAFEKGMK